MIFKTQTLRGAVLTAMQHEIDEHARRVAEYETASEAAERQWLARHAQTWRDAVRTITHKLEVDDEPITRLDLPRYDTGSMRDNLLTYNGPTNERGYRIDRPRDFEESSDLRALLTVLDLTADETVSTHGLKELGLGQGVMSRVVRHLGVQESS